MFDWQGRALGAYEERVAEALRPDAVRASARADVLAVMLRELVGREVPLSRDANDLPFAVVDGVKFRVMLTDTGRVWPREYALLASWRCPKCGLIIGSLRLSELWEVGHFLDDVGAHRGQPCALRTSERRCAHG